MSKDYYYFAASLPSIAFDTKPILSLQEFLEDCQRLLSTDDARVITALLNDEVVTSNNAAVKQWQKFEVALRNEMVVFRAQELHKDPSDFLRGERSHDSSVIAIIQQAAKNENLLEGEKLIDAKRWEVLEGLQAGQYFNFDFILVYGLKLKILEKYQRIASPRGEEIFEGLKQVEIPLA